MKSLKLLILSILVSTSINAQNTYYVDTTNGNDNNNGITTGTAWKTITKVNQQNFSAGDSILFKRGEIWSGTRLSIASTSGAVGAHIVYGAYGTGEKPIISSVIPQSHSWTNTSGNIWKATNPPANHPHRILINGTEKPRANSQSELDGSTYFWLYDEGTNDLFIYSAVDPNGFSIEYSTDFPIIFGWASYITVRDIDVQGGWTGIFINTASKNIHLDNLTIGKYCRNGISIDSSSTIPSDFPENILIENCTFDSFYAFDYSSSTTTTRGVNDGLVANKLNLGEVRNCYFKNWGHASINLFGADVTNTSINNNFLTSPDISYGGRLAVDDAKNNEIFNNQIFNTSVQSQLNGQSNHYHHNIFQGTKTSPITPGFISAGVELTGYANSNVKENIYENNLFINIEGPGFRISGNNNNDIHDNIFRNNIIYNCGTITNGKSIVVEANSSQATYDNSIHNNLIFNSSTTQTCNFRGITYDVTNFDLQSGTDGYSIANNISNDPLFFDSNNNDYHLSDSSPCINAGTATLSTLDFEGNTIPLNGTDPDIGLYEYQSTLGNNHYVLHNSVTLYPNPVTDYLTVAVKNNRVENISLINVNGQIVLRNISASASIDVSNVPGGIYFARIETSNGTITKKVVLAK